MAAQAPGSFWDAVRAWADSAGITVAAAKGEGRSPRPTVPESVCANCPICQGAATLEQINPAIIDDLTNLAHSLLGGIGSALTVAAEQRHRLSEGPEGDPHSQDAGPPPEGGGPAADDGRSGPGPATESTAEPGPATPSGSSGAGSGWIDRQAPSASGPSAPAA